MSLTIKRVGIIGSGMVGEALAAGFLQQGCEVMIGSRSPEKLIHWKEKAGPRGLVGRFEEAARFGDVVVLACLGRAAEAIVEGLNSASLAGKTIIDATNPISEQPPVQGVLSYFTEPNDSLMERLQRIAPEAHWVKAYSCVGSAFMVSPKFPGGRPTMFICGENAQAKKQVTEILDAFGWDAEDMGGAPAARAIEPLARLWCIPGITQNRWGHAFKLLKL
jgi:8-hydroxy-5-deazaflavin:NADPH oxidoreductase